MKTHYNYTLGKHRLKETLEVCQKVMTHSQLGNPVDTKADFSSEARKYKGSLGLLKCLRDWWKRLSRLRSK